MTRNKLAHWLCLLIATACLLAGCGGGSGSSSPLPPPLPAPPPQPDPPFESRGLGGFTVIAFAQTETTVAAGTDGGIYLFEGDDRWALKTPQDWSILALEALYPSRLMASVRVGPESSLLVESLNGGEDWRIVENNFGVVAGFQQREPIQSLLFRDDTGELFATGYTSLAVSGDFGRNWQVLDGEWGGIGTGLPALSHASSRDDYWYGGQGALEDPVLLAFSRSSGARVDHSAAVESLLPRPSTVERVRFYPGNDDLVYIMGEGGLIASSNYGVNWDALLVNDRSRFYFDLVIDSQSGVLYTGGWDKNFTDPQPLILEISTDSGLTWTAVEHEDRALQGGIYSLLLWEQAGAKRLFLGLQGGGVYEARLSSLPGHL